MTATLHLVTRMLGPGLLVGIPGIRGSGLLLVRISGTCCKSHGSEVPGFYL